MLKRIQRYPKMLLIWLFISVLIMVVHIVLPKAYAYDLTAILLSVIAAIYVGFALVDGRRSVIQIEVTAATITLLFAILGLWFNPYFWVLGLFLHGVWDWFHHNDDTHGIKTHVPDYYPPLCVVVDWSLALFFVIWLSVNW